MRVNLVDLMKQLAPGQYEMYRHHKEQHMDFQTPKYRIGEEVWLGTVHWSSQPVECPDCLGQREWTVSTPSGETFQTHCRTCWHGFEESYGTVSQYAYHSRIERLTVGLVETRQSEQGTKVKYMCEETGVGSGTMHDEAQLYPSELDARQAAAMEVQRKRAEDPLCVEEDERRQRQKDLLIVEDCPRKALQDEVDSLKRQLATLKKRKKG